MNPNQASDAQAASAALDVSHMSHRFGARAALSDVSLQVERGRFMALLGPNGAGKTTLFSGGARKSVDPSRGSEER